MKRLLVMLLKVAVSAAIIGYLVYDATECRQHGNVFANLVDQPKQWNRLAVASACCLAAVLLMFVRWWYLVRALDVPCRFGEAVRISFWGFLFNLAPLGIVGGDLVKAVMLDHEHPGHRAKAAASVLVDRVIGLYVLFIVASTAILLTAFWRVDGPDIHRICMATFAVTLASTVGLAVVLGPDMTHGRAIELIRRSPRAGPPLESLVNAVRMYSREPLVLGVSSLMTVGVHCLFAIGCYLIACGLPGNHLSLTQHFVVWPLSAAMQVLPVPIGPTEFALDYLYANVPVAGPRIAAGQGLVVALVYRLITAMIAALGVLGCLGSRREIAEVIHEKEKGASKAPVKTGME